MNWLLWLLIGVVLGWLIELVIDYLFWQRKWEERSAELVKVQGRIGDLESRALAAQRDATLAATKLDDLQSSLEKAHADLTGAHAIQESLRKNIQVLEDRVDNWGRKIGLLAGSEGVLNQLGTAFSADADEDLQNQITLIHARLNGAPDLPAQLIRDPLHEINGIGAVYEQRLNDAGIFTFAELLAAGERRIQEIINPKDWQTINTADWLAQARQLSEQGRAR